MLNQVILVGRIVKDPEIYETETGKKLVNLTLAVSRSFKNMNGEYDTDFIPCTLWQGIAENAKEYCKKGDLVGIKGRIQMRKEEQDDISHSMIEIVVERLTFLSGKRGDE